MALFWDAKVSRLEGEGAGVSTEKVALDKKEFT